MPGVVGVSSRRIMTQLPPFIIGVAGGSASGKSSVCDKIMDRLSQLHRRQVVTVCQDAFYRPLSTDEAHKADHGEFNFDHPDAFELSMMMSTLTKLRDGSQVTIPKYDFKTNSRVKDDYLTVKPADVILVEGILIFYDKPLRDLFNMKLFVDTDPDIRLARRVQRDIRERGRELNHVLNQYLNLVKPAYEEFCLPTKKYADVIIPRGAENEVAIDLIVQHIREVLRSPRGSPMCTAAVATADAPATIDTNVATVTADGPMSPTRRGRQRPH